ncbi:MAG: hypothetical protein HFI68_06090 [Lachnospiraceae bacterium]|nr:hypothetical protein [Lachnospiraceae bacterium]
MIKQVIIGILTTTAVLSVGIIGTRAAESGWNRKLAEVDDGGIYNAEKNVRPYREEIEICGTCGGNFVDADGDGVCDLCSDYAAAGCGRHYVDADGDGICDYAGNGCPRVDGTGTRGTCGGNFVDVDGDGICDYAGYGCPHEGRICGTCGGNFVDADGDGICDICSAYAGAGSSSDSVNTDYDGAYANGTARGGHHCGRGQGNGHGRHCR